MRIRSIKPEFWRSPDISSLSIEDRLLFVGLWSYVDDNGVGEDRESMIAADLFADDLSRDPRETFARVSRGLSNLFTAGRIVRYTVDGRDFLEITNWLKHQRIDKPAKPRYPQYSAGEGDIRESVASLPEIVAPGTGEQGNRGTGEQGSLSADESADDGTLIPDDWMPTQKHLDLARSLKQDIDRQAHRFIEHAHQKQRRQKNWHAAFTNWLKQGAVMAQQRQGAPAPQTFAQQKQANALALVDKYRMEEDREEVGNGKAAHLRALDSGR